MRELPHTSIEVKGKLRRNVAASIKKSFRIVPSSVCSIPTTLSGYQTSER